MNILVTGATGFVGAELCHTLVRQGHRVTALSRDPARAKQTVPGLAGAHAWEPADGPAPRDAFEDVEGVVHLLGESVVGRWTSAKKQAIRDSRVVGTRHLVDALRHADPKPHIFVSASAIGYYGNRNDEELTETSSPGADFLASVSREWEAEASKAEQHGIRVSRLRIGIVLARGGGALGAMLLPFQLAAGGPLGSGRQWWSWIHRDDLIGLVGRLLETGYQGVVNGVAPSPVRQKEFARVLGRVLSRPAFMPAPALALKIVLGGFSSELLSSKRVLPAAAEQLGYRFQYPELEVALRRALGK